MPSDDNDSDDYGPGETPGDIDAHLQRQTDALLWAIGAAETSPAAMLSGDAFTTFYSGLRFSNLDDHPVLTGERRGVRLSDAMCRAAGHSPGCVSTAAGAWQIIRPTWEAYRAAGSWGPRLPDFGPESQAEAARRILGRVGALDALARGDWMGAVALASSQWASLPGSRAQQRPKSLEQFAGLYNQGLQVSA